uniref:Uncharacterized protein n=1 Tax=Lotharella globosa TaxID=91324 RepID=A0A7S3YHP3_9EUKA
MRYSRLQPGGYQAAVLQHYLQGHHIHHTKHLNMLMSMCSSMELPWNCENSLWYLLIFFVPQSSCFWCCGTGCKFGVEFLNAVSSEDEIINETCVCALLFVHLNDGHMVQSVPSHAEMLLHRHPPGRLRV